MAQEETANIRLSKDAVEVHSDWYNRTVNEISLHKDTLSKKESKKYKLDLLLRIVRRVDDFSSYCGECQAFQGEITRLIADLGNLLQLPGKESRKNYNKTISNIVKHPETAQTGY